MTIGALPEHRVLPRDERRQVQVSARAASTRPRRPPLRRAAITHHSRPPHHSLPRNFAVRYKQGAAPVMFLENEQGEVEQEMALSHWKSESLEDYLREMLVTLD